MSGEKRGLDGGAMPGVKGRRRRLVERRLAAVRWRVVRRREI